MLGACGGTEAPLEERVPEEAAAPRDTTPPQDTGGAQDPEEPEDPGFPPSPLTPKAGVTLEGRPACGWENRDCPDSLACYLLLLDTGVRGVCLEDDRNVCAKFTCARGTCSVRESYPPQVICG